VTPASHDAPGIRVEVWLGGDGVKSTEVALNPGPETVASTGAYTNAFVRNGEDASEPEAVTVQLNPQA